jgi:DNA-directed RNA polymerase subunit RPC12/RpoP
MNATCVECGEHLETAWTFCPHCAAPCRHNAGPVPRKHEAAPVTGGFSGLLFGLIAAPALIISGGMICLTGLGIFLGVPLIILGVLSPLLGPVLGLNQERGECPWCSAKIGSVALFDRFSCPACSKRIVVRKRELLRAE